MDKEKIKKALIIFLSEIIATAILMFLGCAGCINSVFISFTPFHASFNYGIIVMVCIQCFGHISGSHINPSVSLSAFIYGKISLGMMFVYIVAQIIGAIVGYGLLMAVIPDAITHHGTSAGVCITAIHLIKLWQAFVIEFLITMALILVCCAVWDPRNAQNTDSTSIRFGLFVAGVALSVGAFTGASMNPARSLAPAIWNNYWADHWMYWVSPLLASAVTTFMYIFVFREGKVSEDE